MAKQPEQDIAAALVAQAQSTALAAVEEHLEAVAGLTAEELLEHLGHQLDAVDIVYEGADLAGERMSMGEAILIAGLTRARNGLVDARTWLETQAAVKTTKKAVKAKTSTQPRISEDEDL